MKPKSNRENYKRTFQVLHSSREISWEESAMKNRRRHNRLVSAACALVIMTAAGSIGYAANVGGIRTTIELWLNGQKTKAVIAESESGSGNFTVSTPQGDILQSGGGVVMDKNGGERPLTLEEYASALVDEAQISKTDEGRIWMCWRDQKADITDKFQNGICRIKLPDGEGYIYFVIHDGGDGSFPYSSSTEGYPE